MTPDRIEGKWIDLFADVFARCKVAPGDACAVLSESQSRALNVQLAELALHRLGARPFHVALQAPRSRCRDWDPPSRRSQLLPSSPIARWKG